MSVNKQPAGKVVSTSETTTSTTNISSRDSASSTECTPQGNSSVVTYKETSHQDVAQSMQLRILALENQLKSTQAMLKQRDQQNETLKAALQNEVGSCGKRTAAAILTPTQTETQTVSAPHPLPPPTTQTSAVSPLQLTVEPLAEPFMPSAYPQLYTSSTHSGTAAQPFSVHVMTPTVYSYNPRVSAVEYPSHNAASNVSANTSLGQRPFTPRKIQDLPEFGGSPEEWPAFYTAFIESTEFYGYSDFENNQRLQKCLKGEARETIKSLLIHPCNVFKIVEELKFRFGRPEQLIRNQLAQVRDIIPIPENAIERIIPFATKVKNIVVFLKSAQGETHLASPTLLDELLVKLPLSKRIEWATFAATVQPHATVLHFSEWLSRLANFVCTVCNSEPIKEPKRRIVLHAAGNQRLLKCPMCHGPHKSYECSRFITASVPNRWMEAKKCRLCFSCLNVGHSTRDCKRRKPCSIDGCKRMHHKLLHDNSYSRNITPTAETDDHAVHPTHTEADSSFNREPVQPAPVLSCKSDSNESRLLYRILPVTLYGRGKQINTYALLDEGSSVTMLDQSLIEELGVRGQKQYLNVQWFGGRAAQEPAILVELFISGIDMTKKHRLSNVYAVSNLQLPSQSLSVADIKGNSKRIRNLSLQPYSNASPKLLIGLDHCHLGLPTTTMKLSRSGPFAANTELGWIVFGPSLKTLPKPPTCLFTNSLAAQTLHNLVADYFETESFGVKASPPIVSEADARANEILKSTTRRVDGRFQTGLLWKSDDIFLPVNYDMALRRLASVEKKMRQNPDFGAAYRAIINSYIMKKYARKLSPTEVVAFPGRGWYLPHFAVMNPNKPGKLRMVFDAAAEVNGVSLNSQLLKGPQDYRPLPSILFQFRVRAVAVCGDIKEMFHQVLVRPEDRWAQRFLWRDGNSERQPDVYEMCVMTFGAACSPCAANYIKTQNALQHSCDDATTQRAVKSILDHHYVDDFVDSFHSTEEAIAVSNEVRVIHMNAGFELRNFVSNSPSVIAALDGIDSARPMATKETIMSEKVLGLYWQPSTDCFNFKLRFINVHPDVINGNRPPTKRELLRIVMSIFDPLGFLCHFVVGAKLLMREVWKQGIYWDDPLPSNTNAAWERWRVQLPAVTKFAVPRLYFRNGTPSGLQLHVFVDASENAFAAVAYWRAINSKNEVEVSFISAKCKVAPLKTLTVPRLELQAAVLGARLMQTVRDEHEIKVEHCVLWSDSKIVIKWIRSKHRRYKPFVQHRVAEIVATTEVSNWRWIPTNKNVADEATRPNCHIEFGSSNRWVCGPQFLSQSESTWPTDDDSIISEEVDKEEIPLKYALVTVSCEFVQFNNFSSLNRLVRTMAWVLRFVRLCRRINGLEHNYGLTAQELNAAKCLLCRIVQRQMYATELQLVENGQPLQRNSSLAQLSPYIDEDGVLRVYGRIDAATWLPMSARRPTILPPNHIFSKLIVAHHHRLMRHQNIEATICEIRREFWIPRLRTLLRNVVACCPVCRLNRATPRPPLMGPLPEDRVTPYVRPFTYTGLDYFGPVTVTIRRSVEKRWIAVFTCLTIRAIHLELAHDLSTDSCIVAIRNFINRRGVPARLRSDNGKNFVGVDSEAKRFADVFDCARVQSELSHKGIEWIFNSPFNPAEGGAWERMVQSVKKVLRHTLKEVSPREHTLNCLLIEAENIINSRPLTHLPVSVDQEQPLTPNDFLIGSANVSQTPGATDVIESVACLRKQWRIARQLRDHFWKRWQKEYLPTLTRRVKWCQRSKGVEVGDLVYLCDPNVPRREWCRGKIVRLYPGLDGETRRVDVLVGGTIKCRAVSKLAVLDLGSGESS